MKKLIVLIFSISLYALSSLDVASRLIDDKSRSNELTRLFPANSYMKNSYPNIAEIVKVLKMSSLMEYTFEEAKNYQLHFNTKSNPVPFLKTISYIFENMGINYYMISGYEKNDDLVSISYVITSKFLIDPASIYEILESMNVKITDINRENEEFFYTLDLSKMKFPYKYLLKPNEEIAASKALEDYFIRLVNVTSLKITNEANPIWYPKYIFLDSDLDFISSNNIDTNTQELEIKIPTNCAYIIITDTYNLENIKHGINIKAE